jgi:spermidine synthase
MGMVSPFAVRLATQSVSMVGKVSGTLYALSTAGSIAGTLLTTFVLIPWFGLSTILNGLGVCLLVVSILTWPFGKSNQALAAMTLVGGLTLAFSLGAASPTARLGPYDELVVDVDTPYHRISVVDSAVVVDKRSLPSRSLRFDRFVESEILKAPPYPSVAGYTNYFHLAFLAKPEIKRVLFIGAGGGIGPRTFQMHNPDMEIDVVDVDPKVLELARTHFHLEEHPKIRLTAKDGRIYVRQSTATYDCIILDAFSAGGRIPFHLVTKEFLQLCADRLAPDGVFLMNINSALEGPRAQIFQSIYRTFDAVFPNTYVFAMDHQQRPTQFTMNVILLGTRDKTRLTRAQWATRAADYRSTSYVNPRMVRAMVDDLLVTLPDMSRAPLFTDDYAPIETMPF